MAHSLGRSLGAEARAWKRVFHAEGARKLLCDGALLSAGHLPLSDALIL